MLSFPQTDVNVGNASLELLGASRGVMGRGCCFRMTTETRQTRVTQWSYRAQMPSTPF